MTILAALGAAVTMTPTAMAPDVLGSWRSITCEAASATAPVSMRRTFVLSEARWRVEVTIFDGPSCATPDSVLEVEGAWTATGRSSPIPQALEITAFYDRKRATALSPAGARRLSAARCGPAAWRPGLTQDISGTGCLSLAPITPECLQEYDLIALRGGVLSFGARTGNMCTPSGRPRQMSPFALERVPASAISRPAPAGAGGFSLPAITRMADLTHTLDEKFPYIPVPGVTFPFRRDVISTLERDSVAAGAWRIHEHLGTQIDAPSHFAESGRSLHELRPDELIRPMVIVDVRERAAADPDLVVTAAYVRSWEGQHGAIPPGPWWCSTPVGIQRPPALLISASMPAMLNISPAGVRMPPAISRSAGLGAWGWIRFPMILA